MAGSKPEIGAKIVLDGAEEYQRSLKEVTNAQRDLTKEMKLAESEFKATGDAQKYYEEKTRLLNAQMDNQKKKLETAQKALKELSDKGVDKNSDLWRKWNNTLIETQTKMNNLQAELNTTSDAMKETATAAEQVTEATEQVTQATERATQETADYSETLKSIDKGVKFGNILNGLRVIKDAVSGVISTAYRMGKALVMSQISGGDWAREIMTEAAKAGVSVEEYQARLYAQSVSGIDTNAITEGVKKTTENLATTDAELLKLYNDLGISTRNVNGDVRDATETFWDSVDALKNIEDQTTRSIYAQKLLGDQYLELRGLVDLGSEGYEKLIEEGKATATVTEDSVKALSDMDAAYEKVNSTAQSIKHSINAELAPGFTELAGAFTQVLSDFDKFLQSEEGKAVFDQWNTTLTDIANTVKDADFSDAFTAIAETFSSISESIKFLVDNRQTIMEILDGLVRPNSPLALHREMLDSKENFKNKLYIEMPNTQAEDNIQNALEETEELRGNIERANSGIAASAEELIAIQRKAISAYLQEDYALIAKELEAAMSNPNYEPFLKNQELLSGMGTIVNTVSSGGTPESWDTYNTLKLMLDEIEAVMSEAATTAEAGGGGAMDAFNAAIEKGTADTKGTLKSGVTAAFSGFDSLFASMGTAHGASYINALSAQMSRINSMLSLSPSYAYGGSFLSPAQSAYASPTSTANVSLYVGREKFGQVATPIVDARMGADLMTMR